MKFLMKRRYSVLKIILKYLPIFLIGLYLLLPLTFVSASLTGCGTGSSSTPCIDTKINNPLSTDINSIPKLIEVILNIVITIGVPIVVLAIIYSGFLFVSAQGNESKLKTAKSAIIFTLIGAALLLGSWVIANAIQGTINEIKSKA